MSVITMAMVLDDVSVLVSQLQNNFHSRPYTRSGDEVLPSPMPFDSSKQLICFSKTSKRSTNPRTTNLGIHLAERNLFIGVAKLLWAFNFSVKRGEKINTDAETSLSQGFLHCVKEYGSSITVRSEKRRDTIWREFEDAKATFARFE